MRKRTIMAVAAGVVAGATVVGVPTLAYAGDDSGGGMSGSDMGSMMEDPAFLEQAKTFMSEMMSDPTLREQMRSMMDGMGDMSGMGGMAGEDDPGNP
ncbi:conserved exported protein of unknown function [Modestobacter italicus]|uniref:Uncharacterized protein n=1 Tax=Modestobacter italicus (strain DSM 44449 / CECT 9708 / BC 501) TaxID=2732864 RepID=I4EUH5_MODI5|nr:hypothetical protein [Modestobacter marinus]CCH87038.1 conserved exported protein of unknown function [Modestobacter marinus]